MIGKNKLSHPIKNQLSQTYQFLIPKKHKIIPMGSLTTLPELLIVDFNTEEMKPGSNSWSSACKSIRTAFENHGCFIALCDYVTPQLHSFIFKAADDLFDLPIETKVQNINEKPYHGYVGQMPIVPLHEALGIDYATTLQGVQSFTNLMWPQGNPSFWYIYHYKKLTI